VNPIRLRVHDPDRLQRRGYLIEQGIPVEAMPPEQVRDLRLLRDGRVCAAEFQPESVDPDGRCRWAMLTTSVDTDGTDEYCIQLAPDLPAAAPRLSISQSDGRIGVSSDVLAIEMSGLDEFRLSHCGQELIAGKLAFSLMHDAQTFVSGCRTMHLRPLGFSIEEQSESRCLALWRARMHPDVYREYGGVNLDRYLDCELEMRIYAASPVVRLKWIVTNQFGYPMRLEKYALALPLAPSAKVTGEWTDKFRDSAVVSVNGSGYGLTAPFVADIGKGAGIGLERLEWLYDEEDGFAICDATPEELPCADEKPAASRQFRSAARPAVLRSQWRITVGGINPPPDEGCGTDNPQIHRTWLPGMSRTFESSIVPGAPAESVAAELSPLNFTLDPQHYSDTCVLPERGDRVTFGEFEEETRKSAELLLRMQWRESLYFGEWWREYCLTRGQGIEESGSGNSSLGLWYHYLRTGDVRFLAGAKRSMLAIFDLTMNKQKDGIGPYMHTRRFLFDRETWHHTRYQRISGMMRPSHFFCDRRMRARAVETVRWFAEHFVDADGAPLFPGSDDPDGPKSRCGEAAMAQFCETLLLAYQETGDTFFLEKAKLMADWMLGTREAAESLEKWLGNWNSQFQQRALLAMYLGTGDRKFVDAYVGNCRGILNIPPRHDGYRDLVLWEVHFVVYYAWHFAEAHRICGDDGLLREFVKVLNEELKRQDDEGYFPYVTMFVPRLSEWNSYYDQKTCAAYLPVLAARMASAGISRFES